MNINPVPFRKHDIQKRTPVVVMVSPRCDHKQELREDTNRKVSFKVFFPRRKRKDMR